VGGDAYAVGSNNRNTRLGAQRRGDDAVPPTSEPASSHSPIPSLLPHLNCDAVHVVPTAPHGHVDGAGGQELFLHLS